MSSQSEYHVIVLIYLNGDYYKISVNRFYTVLSAHHNQLTVCHK